MKTMKKYTRVMSLVLAVMMLFSVVSVTAFAADYTFDYDFTDDTMTDVYVSEFKGTVPSDGVVEIPDTIDGYPVVGIGEQAFANLSSLKKIIVPATVQYIDEDAFKGCVNIIDVEIRNDDEIEVGEDVFDSTQWFEDHKQDYVISGTTLIGYKGTDEIVTIPYNCTKIADGVFKGNTYIKTVYIEKELKSIGANAFKDCTSLENVVAGSGVRDITVGENAFEGTPWFNNYPSTFVILGTTLIKYKGTADYVSIPNVITSVSTGAFYVGDETKNITFKVKVPVTVETFGDDCFYLYDSASKVYPEVLVYAGSAAETYCKQNGIKFKYSIMPGDVNNDGHITAADARYVLRISAKLESPVLDDEIKEAADLSGNGKIAADDARLILRIAAQLEEYSVDKLLTMPRSDYEVLLTAANALSLAKAYGCAYSKLAYQSMDEYNMNINTRTYLNQFRKELVSEKKAQTVTYGQDTPEALNNLFDITLIDASMIKDYSCVINDGYYNIKITLADETINGFDLDTVTSTEKMFPVATVSHFTNNITNKYWYKSGSFDYDLTYNNCTLEMKVEISTLKLASVTVVMNYHFVITGKILGISISGDKNKPATADRTDTIKYTNFVYSAN